MKLPGGIAGGRFSAVTSTYCAGSAGSSEGTIIVRVDDSSPTATIMPNLLRSLPGCCFCASATMSLMAVSGSECSGFTSPGSAVSSTMFSRSAKFKPAAVNVTFCAEGEVAPWVSWWKLKEKPCSDCKRGSSPVCSACTRLPVQGTQVKRAPYGIDIDAMSQSWHFASLCPTMDTRWSGKDLLVLYRIWSGEEGIFVRDIYISWYLYFGAVAPWPGRHIAASPVPTGPSAVAVFLSPEGWLQ